MTHDSSFLILAQGISAVLINAIHAILTLTLTPTLTINLTLILTLILIITLGFLSLESLIQFPSNKAENKSRR